MKEEVRDVFNQMAGAYEYSVDNDNLYNAEYERPAVMARIPENLSGKKVLDAGCAAGWYSFELLARGAEVAAIDMSPEMAEAARRRTGNNAKVLCLDLEKELPFDDESFDLILSSLTLHYIENWESTFSEFQRILKSKGTFLFSVHHPLTDMRLLAEPEYFSTQLIVDVWKKDGKAFKVPFYRRPLNTVINDTLKHFELTRIIEPLPTSTFKERDPERFGRLMKEPNFLIVEARKR